MLIRQVGGFSCLNGVEVNSLEWEQSITIDQKKREKKTWYMDDLIGAFFFFNFINYAFQFKS